MLTTATEIVNETGLVSDHFHLPQPNVDHCNRFVVR